MPAAWNERLRRRARLSDAQGNLIPTPSVKLNVMPSRCQSWKYQVSPAMTAVVEPLGRSVDRGLDREVSGGGIDFDGRDPLLQCISTAVDAIAFDLLEGDHRVKISVGGRHLRPGLTLTVFRFPKVVQT